ncbi:MAG: carbohydrate ABC transporter permease [Clostridia bacterium]|nr:carbohydrate ABC transporter permease [Clostridia bacterium]
MANKRQKANIAAAIKQSGATPDVTTQGSMTQPNSAGVSIFVPNRGAVATPPPLNQPKKKVKLSNEQNIYMAKKKIGSFSISLVTIILILGLCFVILHPFLKLVPTVLSNPEDLGNPNIIWLPEEFSTMSFEMATYHVMKAGPMTIVSSISYALAIMAIQVFVSAMTGYTMARVKYKWVTPLLFVMVILSFLVPRQSLLVAQYVYFQHFDAFYIMRLWGAETNLIGNPWSLYMMAILGFGVNQSLMILIFSQFFKNIPKELEEAALIDGCGFYKTYFNIMVPNAIPAIVIVAILAFVWNYGDTYFTRYFDPDGQYLGTKLATVFANNDTQKRMVQDTATRLFGLSKASDLTFDAVKQAGVLIFLLPLLAVYLFAQRWLVENLESSGLVG